MNPPRHLPLLRLILLGGLAIPFTAPVGCGPGAPEPLTGRLEAAFTLRPSASDDVEPSYQTTVWLEDREGNYLKSLYVSEYLAYGGYEDEEICPDWSRVADWASVPETTFDAVSSATPPLNEEYRVSLDLAGTGLMEGAYRFGVETHVIEDMNVLFRGEILLDGEARAVKAEAKYRPKRHPGAGAVIEGVEVRYVPGR